MTEEPVMACMACGGRIYDDAQQTCPHCLDQLRVRTFGSPSALDDFQNDRRHHDAYIEPEPSRPKRGLALVLAFAGTLMLAAVLGMALVGLATPSGSTRTTLIATAVVPLGMAAGLLRLALRYSGGKR